MEMLSTEVCHRILPFSIDFFKIFKIIAVETLDSNFLQKYRITFIIS